MLRLSRRTSSARGRAVFDVTIGPDGTPWAAFVDGCDGKDKCITKFEAVGIRGEAVVGRLVGGPSLGLRKRA